MNSEILMARSKGYTNMVALGLSNVTVNDKTGVVTFELNDGSSASYTFPKPKDGISVTGVNDKEDGTFTLLLSDGSETSAVQTIKGQKGDKGKKYSPPCDRLNPGYGRGPAWPDSRRSAKEWCRSP